MKRKLLCILFLLFAVVVMAELKLNIIDLNGQEKLFTLSQLGKITFENGVMYLYSHDGVMLGYNDVEQVGQVVVEQDGTTSLASVNGTLRVYADSEQQCLFIIGLPENQKLRVFNLEGKLLLTIASQPEQTQIDVSGLQDGTYLLQFGSQVVKFIKQ